MKTFDAGGAHRRIKSELSAQYMKKNKSNRHKKVSNQHAKFNLANDDQDYTIDGEDDDCNSRL